MRKARIGSDKEMGWQEIIHTLNVVANVSMVIWVLLVSLMIYVFLRAKKEEDERRKGDTK